MLAKWFAFLQFKHVFPMAGHESYAWVFLHLPHSPCCSGSVGGLGGSFLDSWSLSILCTASSPASIDFICDCDISYVRAMSTALSKVSYFPSLINFSLNLREFLQKTILSRIISSGSLKEQFLTRSFRSVTNCSTYLFYSWCLSRLWHHIKYFFNLFHWETALGLNALSNSKNF